MSKSSSDLNRSDYLQLLREAGQAERRITADYALLDIGDDYLDTEVSFALTAGGKESSPVLRLTCSFEAHLHSGVHLDKRFADQFVESELRLIAWPYFRQFVFDTTARMMIPPVIVPFATRHDKS
jgi:hypothetical protein